MCLGKEVHFVEKQTKNRITRDMIEKNLYAGNKADIQAYLIWGGSLSVVFIPHTIGLVAVFASFFENLFLKIACCSLIGIIMSSPVWLFLVFLIISLRERALLQNGEFEIVVRTVSDKTEGVIRRHPVEYLHFEGFKEVAVDHATFQMASHGDEFYIVHYKPKRSIEMLYPAKMYELFTK